MRRGLVLGGMVGAAALVVTPVAALALPRASTGGATAPVTCQTTRWTNVPVAAPATFGHVSALNTGITAIYPAVVTVSGVVQGRPVTFQVVDHWIMTETAQPGPVTVTPVAGQATPFSFTWIATGSSAAPRGHSITVDWRRTVAGSSTLVEADVAVRYTTDVC